MKQITIIALILVAIIGLWFVSGRNQAPADTRTAEQILQIQSTDHVLGNPDATNVFVEYLDFQCPACAAYHSLTTEFLAQYGNEVAFVQRHFPLYFHVNGENASYAVEAAYKQGKGEELADILLTSQQEWAEQAVNPNLFDVYAEGLGLNMTQFVADRTSEEVKTVVRNDMKSGRTIGVSGTPSFFLNGQAVNGMQSAEDFAALLALESPEQPEVVVEGAPSEEEVSEEVATTTATTTVE